MALYIEATLADGTKRMIPAINREKIPVDPSMSVRSMRVIKKVICSRSDLDERRYRSTDLERVIKNLRERDEIKIRTYPESYPEKKLTITKNSADEVVGVNSTTGERYYLIPRFWGSQGQGDGQPWLRTDDWDSRGEIEEIEVLTLEDTD